MRPPGRSPVHASPRPPRSAFHRRPGDASTSPGRRPTLGYLLALATACLWSTMTIIGKLLIATGADPVVLVGLRVFLAFVLLATILAVADRRLLAISPRDIPFFVAYGATLAANCGFYFLALESTTGTTAVVLAYSYPVILAVLAALFLGERLTGIKLVALALTLGGCLLVAQANVPGALETNLRGVLFGLGTALGMASYAALTKVVAGRFGPWTLLVWGFGFGSVILLGARAGALGAVVHFPASVWAGLLAAAVFPTLLGYTFFVRAVAHIEVTRVCITASIEPAVVAALAWALLGERLAASQWMGAAATLAGVILVQTADLRAGRVLSSTADGDAAVSRPADGDAAVSRPADGAGSSLQ